MARTLKAYIKRAVRALLSIDALALALRGPVNMMLKINAKIDNKFKAIYRNLPQIRRLLLERDQTKTQVAAKYFTELADRVADFPLRPTFSVLIPVYKVRPEFLRECLQSVVQQVYPDWELCIVDDASGMAEIKAVIDAFKTKYPSRVKAVLNPTNVHISKTSNECLKLATGDFVVLLDHDDRLYPHALAEMARQINLHSDPDILYSDECTIDDSGDRIRLTYHKPDWSPFMHLTMNYTTHLSCYRRSLVNQIGGFRAGFEGSQDHDLMLRMVEASSKPVVHVPFCLYQWRAHAESTAKSQDSKPYAAIAGEKAVTEHLARRGRPAKVQFNRDTLIYRIEFELPKPLPLVSIVIPSKDSPNLVRQCVDSVINRSTYPNFEIIISDNGSTDPQTLAHYDRWQQLLGNRFKVLLKPRPFNFGAQVNDGVRVATGEYVLLLNNDTSVREPAWIEEMLSLAQFPEVGAVGCRLFFKNRLTQHAGIVLSTRAIAEHLGFGLAENHPHYWNVLNTIHETMAVTAACLMIRKDKYWQVGGLDQVHLPRGYGDVAFCLELRRRGYSNLYTPYARLFHDESVSRGKTVEYYERFFLLSRYGQELAADPYLNLNFQRDPGFNFDTFYDGLDFDQREFRFFLDTPIEQWRARSLTLDY